MLVDGHLRQPQLRTDVPQAAAPPRPRLICKRSELFGRWDCVNARQRERAKEARFAACPSLLKSPATGRPPPKCAAFRRQPHDIRVRQTGCWRKPDSNSQSHLIESLSEGAGSVSPAFIAGTLGVGRQTSATRHRVSRRALRYGRRACAGKWRRQHDLGERPCMQRRFPTASYRLPGQGPDR